LESTQHNLKTELKDAASELEKRGETIHMLKKQMKNLVPKEELDIARREEKGALRQWFEEKSRREQIELELRVANNRLSQFKELASQITGSVSSRNLSGFNPMNSMITSIR
jgi:hypothetical protein